MANKDWQAAQAKAASPEARAKAVATMKRRRAEKEALAFANAEQAAKLEDAKNRPRKSALLKHATITKKPKKMKGKLHGGAPKGIPLDLIPDGPKRKKYPKKGGPAKSSTSRQEVVLALLRYLDGE